MFFAMDDIKRERRPQMKVPHNLRFDAGLVKTQMELIDNAWKAFIGKVRKMAERPMKTEEAATFFSELLGETKDKPLSNKAQLEQQAIMSLFDSAPGQDLDSAKETLWGAVNAVTYYTDHVRKGTAGERLDSSWFGAGCALKDRAWAKANKLLA
jgi:hypothetical protein